MAMTMNVKIIKSAEDYEAAMARLSALMSLDPKANSKEENELELLALVIQDFERQTVPPVKADPIESILFRMDQMQLSRKDLIPYIGSISKVSEVLSRKRSLSLPMIRRLNQRPGYSRRHPDRRCRNGQLGRRTRARDGFHSFPAQGNAGAGLLRGFRRERAAPQRVRRRSGQKIHAGSDAQAQASPAFLRAPMHQRGDRQADEMALLAWRMCVLRTSDEPSMRHQGLQARNHYTGLVA
jgi:HTH-type transcriptional regulator/antitoxin HigA